MTPMKLSRWVLMIAVMLVPFAASAQKILDEPQQLKGIDVEEHLGESIPKSLVFADETGKSVTIGSYLNQGKPILLTMAYYRCPMLCGLVLNGVCNSVKSISLVPSKDFTILTVSIDPREMPELALAKKVRYIESYGKEGVKEGWSFLTGSEENSKALANAVGFKYFYDAKRDEYAHPAVSFLIAPDGKIVRYLYGMDYKRFDLKMGLLEAAEGKVGTTIDRIILSCFHYDASQGKYVFFAQNVMRVGGASIVLFLAVFLVRLWVRESRKHKEQGETSTGMDMN
jgi:protein SCO1